MRLQDNGGTAHGGNNSSPSQTFVIGVSPVTQPPSFTPGPNQLATGDGGANPVLYTVPGWATNIQPGPANQSGLTVSFNVTNNNAARFTSGGQPAISPNGTLTYTTAPNAQGSATVTVSLSNNGSTANGGQTTTAPITFVITVTPINNAPSFTPGPNVQSAVYTGTQSVANWATNISAGPPIEAGQALTFQVNNDNPALFAIQPTVLPNGTLQYTAGQVSGTAHVIVSLMDNGGTANGGQNTSGAVTFTITINPAVTSGSADVLWVALMYREVLQREDSARRSGVLGQSAQLRGNAAVCSRADSEQRRIPYPVYPETVPDLPRQSGGCLCHQFLSGAVPSSATDQAVQAEILQSATFSHLTGDSDYGFLNGLYSDVLGRPLDNVAPPIGCHSYPRAYLATPSPC